MRCTQATLQALGIFGKCPKTGTGVLEALKDAGFKIRYENTETMKQYGEQGLRDFIETHQTGRYYLCSEGHAMALVNGRLTDTSQRKVTNRIKVWAAVEVLSQE